MALETIDSQYRDICEASLVREKERDQMPSGGIDDHGRVLPAWKMVVNDMNGLASVRADCSACKQSCFIPNPDGAFLHCGRKDPIPDELRKQLKKFKKEHRPRASKEPPRHLINAF